VLLRTSPYLSWMIWSFSLIQSRSQFINPFLPDLYRYPCKNSYIHSSGIPGQVHLQQMSSFFSSSIIIASVHRLCGETHGLTLLAIFKPDVDNASRSTGYSFKNSRP
jgi:hypothetical protein